MSTGFVSLCQAAELIQPGYSHACATGITIQQLRLAQPQTPTTAQALPSDDARSAIPVPAPL